MTNKVKNSKLKADELLKQAPDLSPQSLGDPEFLKDHKVKYAYVTGSMVRGIASEEMVIKMGKTKLLGFFGSGGLSLEQIESAIHKIKNSLNSGEPFGMNLLCNFINLEFEDLTVDLYLKHGIHLIEASAYSQITSSLVRYRVKGLSQNPDGSINIPNKIMAKISRPEVANQFLSPPSEKITNKLLESGKITEEEAKLSKQIPMADDITAEANSGGHTDNGVAYALMPAMLRLRDDAMSKYQYPKKIRVGAAGGLGTPHAIAAAFIMGADYVVTGSVNQCTPEAGTSDLVKDLLAAANIQDTEMAPAGDMFEVGAKVQVLKRGVFFPARANKLYELYKFYRSLDEIDEKTKNLIENKYFKKSFEEVYEETKNYFLKIAPKAIEQAEKDPKQKMALVFRWYFWHTNLLAMEGIADHKVDFQIHCGPAMGAFNQWVKGTKYEDWHNRHVDEIADLLMNGAVRILQGWL